MKGDKEYVASLNHAKKKEKIVILDEFTKTTGYERKHAIKLEDNFCTIVFIHLF